RAYDAARDRVQPIPPFVVGRRSAGLEQRRLQQLVKRHFGRLAAGRQQRRPMGGRGQQRQRGEQVASGRGQVGHRGGKHLAKDFTFRTRQPLAHALDRLTAAQLADRPAGKERVTRGGGQ